MFRPLTVVLPTEKIMKEAIRMVLSAIYDPEDTSKDDISSEKASGKTKSDRKEDTSKENLNANPEMNGKVSFDRQLQCNSPRDHHAALMRIKEEWGFSSRSGWFLEFDIRKCFHTIDRHRLISIFKEEVDDPKFFYSIQKVLGTSGFGMGVRGRPAHSPPGTLNRTKGGSHNGKKSGKEFTRERMIRGSDLCVSNSVPQSVLLSALFGNIYLQKLDQEIRRIRQKYEIPIVQRIGPGRIRFPRV